MTGTVKHVVPHRGFGFIVPDDGHAPDGIFFHVRDTDAAIPFEESLKGQRVEFEVDHSGSKGARAVRVRKVDA